MLSQRAPASGAEELLQLGHDVFFDEGSLPAGYGVSLGIFYIMLDARLVDQERVVQDHEVIVFDAEYVALEKVKYMIRYI